MSRLLVPGVAALNQPCARPFALASTLASTLAALALLSSCGEPQAPTTKVHPEPQASPVVTTQNQPAANDQAARDQAQQRAAEDNAAKTAAGNKGAYEGLAKPLTDPTQEKVRSGAAATETALTDEKNAAASTIERTTERIADALPASTPQAVDNSGQNRVDRSGAALTPMDQGNSQADLALTQAIRKAVTSDSSLSVNAQNIKIITRDGVVVLRGPVASQAELEAVLVHAKSAAGTARIDNQLAVAAP